MAMVKCNECGNQLSTTASKCPHCGASSDKAVGSTPLQRVAGLLAILMGGAVFLIGSTKENGIIMDMLCAAFVIMGLCALFAPSRKQ